MFPGTRQILNLQEILHQCNQRPENRRRWSSLLRGTPWKGVECRSYSFRPSNTLEGMAVAQQASSNRIVYLSLINLHHKRQVGRTPTERAGVTIGLNTKRNDL